MTNYDFTSFLYNFLNYKYIIKTTDILSNFQTLAKRGDKEQLHFVVYPLFNKSTQFIQLSYSGWSNGYSFNDIFHSKMFKSYVMAKYKKKVHARIKIIFHVIKRNLNFEYIKVTVMKIYP